jgi:hypothetical protein
MIFLEVIAALFNLLLILKEIEVLMMIKFNLNL